MSMFQRSALGDQHLPNGVVVASFETYDQAQAAVAKVSSSDAELAGLAIIGNDLKLVERILGRLTWGKVAMRGAMRGLGFGAFLGLMLLLFVPEAVTSIIIFPLLGLAFGILLSVVQQSLVRRKRDFASTQQVLAARYDVVAPQASAGRAMHIIGQREGAAQPAAQAPAAPAEPTDEQLRDAPPPAPGTRAPSAPADEQLRDVPPPAPGTSAPSAPADEQHPPAR